MAAKPITTRVRLRTLLAKGYPPDSTPPCRIDIRSHDILQLIRDVGGYEDTFRDDDDNE